MIDRNNAAFDLAALRKEVHMETLIIYKLGSMKFATQDDFYK